jgi:small subunit ribosomal protein S16
MLKIRLLRTGRKHEPTFRVVLTDSKNGPKSGKFIEILGNYDARKNDETQLNGERIQYWIAQGAQPSDTVHNLLVRHEVIAGEKRNVLPKKAPIVDEAKIKAEKEAEEKAKQEAEAVKEEESKKEDAPVEEAKEEVADEKKEEVKEESKEKAKAE